MKTTRTPFLFVTAFVSLFFIGCTKESLRQNEEKIDLAGTARKPSGGGGTTTKPTVSFISPVNGGTVTGFTTIKIAASSPYGISNTSLMQTIGTNNCLAGNDKIFPYEYNWNTDYICITRVLPGQQVTLRATAVDTKGNLSFADITVNKQ
jgi:Bacterial Ig domain